MILIMWHARILVLPVVYGRRVAMRALVSRSLDGELTARYLEHLGIGAVRGSSGPSGAAGLRALARVLAEGVSVIVVPDGPRGPREVLKPGVIALARRTGVPIVPVAVGALREWRLGSWDGFRIPKPFSPCVVRAGAPIAIGTGRGGGPDRGGRPRGAPRRGGAGPPRADAPGGRGGAAVIRAVYSAGLAVWLAGYLPVYLARRHRQGALAGLAQRLGRFEPGLPPEPRCWVHAVSVGEAVAAAPLVEAIRARWPRLAVVMTTVTPTGARVVRDRLAGRAAHRYFPVDLPGAVRRALDAVRPRFFIGLETELWPNFYAALGTRCIPAMVANGRISDRSYRGYRRVRFAIAPALARVAAFGMQTRQDADRIVALGAPADRVVVTGTTEG